MEFKSSVNNEKIISFEKWLPKNSLLVMKDEIRYKWKHGIKSRTYDMVYNEEEGDWRNIMRKFRVSVTFRRVKMEKNCDCNFPEMCNFKNPGLGIKR